ncbi:MAG: glycosyltransferase [Patescibacteria group bacterium]|jgi:glycosyltransferase involved in cell wall biosynthesis
MKVLIVSNLYGRYYRSGAETVVKASANGFKELGWEVSVLSVRPFHGIRSLTPVAEEEEGIKVLRFFPLNIFSYVNINAYGFFARAIWGCLDVMNIHSWLVTRAVLRREQPDLVLSHNLRGLGYLLPRLFAKRAKRYIQVVHDVQLVEPSGILLVAQLKTQLSRPIRILYRTLTRHLFRTVGIVVFPSKFLQDFYTGHHFFSVAKRSVLMNPVPDVAVVHKEHKGINVVYIGQIEEQKGIQLLLDVWQTIRRPHWRLILAGAGSYLHAVKKASLEDRSIIVSGFLSQIQLAAIWEVTDVFVYPSLLIENNPMSIVEALSHGVPVVASDIGGVSELLRLAPNTKLVPPGDSEALASAITESAESRVFVRENILALSVGSKEYSKELIALTDLN